MGLASTLHLVAVALSAVTAPGAGEPTSTVPAELFAWFSGVGGDSALRRIDDMPGLTTLACFGWPPQPGFTSSAHKRGVKIVRAVGGITSSNISIHTEQGRAAIVRELVASVVSEGADGLNIDEESYAGEPHDFTALIRGLQVALAPTRRTLSLAVSAYPSNPLYKKIHYRTGLNYTALGAIADYLIIMGYDMVYLEPCSHDGNCSQPPEFPPLANSPLPGLKATVQQYQRLGVPASRLVMALPYFGRDYPCVPRANRVKDKCTILAPNGLRSGNKSLDPAGVGPWPCASCFTHLPSSSVIPRLDYETIVGTPNSYRQPVTYLNKSELRYEPVTQSVFFNYDDTNGSQHQVWYDDSSTLRAKSRFAREAGLRGAGVYAAGMANTTRHSTMWTAIASPWEGGVS